MGFARCALGVGRCASALYGDGARLHPTVAPTAMLEDDPNFSVSRAAARTARSDDPTYLAQLEPILEGMRKAGVPEQ
jgi:hypothetical protein